MSKKKDGSKVWVITVFILIVIAITVFVAKTLINDKNNDDKSETSSHNTTSSSTTNSSNSTSKVTTNSQSSTENAITAFKSLSYYNESLTSRYLLYKQKNSSLPYEQVILRVNIGLDQPFYTNTNNVLNPEQITALVNKYNSIGQYVPKDLVKLSSSNSTKELYMRAEAAKAFEQMCNDARPQGYNIRAMSTYRSYSRQTQLYNNYVSTDGKEAADSYSARPGFSEHQTGLVADVQGGSVDYTQFKTTKESTWINKFAYKYGFIVRYPEGKESITGYVPEAWHLRYVGIEAAKVIHDENLTFDEYCAKYLTK